RRRHTRCLSDWSSDVCSSDLPEVELHLHQGTSEQIAEMVAADRVQLAIATGSDGLFPGLVLLPVYRWHRQVIVPRRHPLAALKKIGRASCRERVGNSGVGCVG